MEHFKTQVLRTNFRSKRILCKFNSKKSSSLTNVTISQESLSEEENKVFERLSHAQLEQGDMNRLRNPSETEVLKKFEKIEEQLSKTFADQPEVVQLAEQLMNAMSDKSSMEQKQSNWNSYFPTFWNSKSKD